MKSMRICIAIVTTMAAGMIMSARGAAITFNPPGTISTTKQARSSMKKASRTSTASRVHRSWPGQHLLRAVLRPTTAIAGAGVVGPVAAAVADADQAAVAGRVS